MSKPEITFKGNLTVVGVGDVTCFFSYTTLVAVDIDGDLNVHQNDWGSTTGKHLNNIDGGEKEAKEQRLSAAEFDALFV